MLTAPPIMIVEFQTDHLSVSNAKQSNKKLSISNAKQPTRNISNSKNTQD